MAENDRVRAAEADIDRFFDDRLSIRGVYRPALVDCLMERAELLVTGARAVTSRDRGALTGLYLNVTGGLNWAIREANRLATGSRDNIPEQLDCIATQAISLGIFYQYVQDAFMSYWKGYARVEFPSTMQFTSNLSRRQLTLMHVFVITAATRGSLQPTK